MLITEYVVVDLLRACQGFIGSDVSAQPYHVDKCVQFQTKSSLEQYILVLLFSVYLSPRYLSVLLAIQYVCDLIQKNIGPEKLVSDIQANIYITIQTSLCSFQTQSEEISGCQYLSSAQASWGHPCLFTLEIQQEMITLFTLRNIPDQILQTNLMFQ